METVFVPQPLDDIRPSLDFLNLVDNQQMTSFILRPHSGCIPFRHEPIQWREPQTLCQPLSECAPILGKRLLNRSCFSHLTRPGDDLNPLARLKKSLQNSLNNLKFVHISTLYHYNFLTFLHNWVHEPLNGQKCNQNKDCYI